MVFLILAADPEDEQWTVLHQTVSADEALDFWQDNPGDPSKRFILNTDDFISFEIEKEESND
jgi:hypothetical protein